RLGRRREHLADLADLALPLPAQLGLTALVDEDLVEPRQRAGLAAGEREHLVLREPLAVVELAQHAEQALELLGRDREKTSVGQRNRHAALVTGEARDAPAVARRV